MTREFDPPIVEFCPNFTIGAEIFERNLNLLKLLDKKTHFLFGARGTGKSFLIERQLRDKAEIITLLDSDIYLQLQQEPSKLRAMIAASKHNWIVIDEIQRIPELLNEVHLALQNDHNKNLRFLLTGSSARRLKRDHANMLGGRARRAALFPLSIAEIFAANQFDLLRFLTYGGLPAVYLSDDPYGELRDYLDTYLTDEIKTEAGVRNLPAFSRFLKVAGLSQGHQINFTKMGNDAQVHPNSVREYFQILVDTLLVIKIEPWREGTQRKPVATAKYYFCDNGIANSACGIDRLTMGTERFGTAFEQAICQELNTYIAYHGLNEDMTYWRTDSGIEVDFIVGSRIGIEAKSSQATGRSDRKSLGKLREEGSFEHLIVVNCGHKSLEIDGIRHIPYQAFVSQLWNGEFF